MSSRRKACFGERALQLVDAREHRVAFGAAVVSRRKAFSIVIAQALHHLSKRHGLSRGKLDNDLRHCGGSPLPAAAPSSQIMKTSLGLTCRSRARMTLAASLDSAWIAATCSTKLFVALEVSRSASRLISAAFIEVGATGIRRLPPPRRGIGPRSLCPAANR